MPAITLASRRTSFESESGGLVTSSPEPIRATPIATDLVEYVVLVIPDPQALRAIATELVSMVEAAAIRVLDLVVVRVLENAAPEVIEIDAVEELHGFRQLSSLFGVLLSRHDLELVALALQPGDWAVVIVAEDRWAEPLAAVARAAGGEVRAGERIARERVEAALSRAVHRHEKGDDHGPG